MFENMSLETLQCYWWIIVSILASALVFLLFVQGGQSLLKTVAKTDDERTLVINAVGSKWELTFTTLVTFGGAFFASFPLFYSTSFGGAYWVWMLLLFSFIIQAVSFEYRTKPSNFLGSKVYEAFLIANGIIAPFVIGTAVGTFFTGSAFYVNEMNLSQWKHSAHGLEALLDPTNVALGLTVLFLSRQLGAMYLLNTIDNQTIINRVVKQIKREALPFLTIAVIFVLLLITQKGYAIDEKTSKFVFLDPYKYLFNLLEMPVVLILFLAGLISIIIAVYIAALKESSKAIWICGSGSFMLTLSLFFLAGFNNTAYYPSSYDLQSSLTIYNSSSSHYTLTAMSYVSLFVPFVIAYIWYAWKAMSKKKLSVDNLKNDEHVY